MEKANFKFATKAALVASSPAFVRFPDELNNAPKHMCG
jgi:hypothetical protein